MSAPLPDDSDGCSIGTLNPNSAKGRFGVAYVRSIVSQAGVGFNETSPDEDALAVDGTVEFIPASARVQIKCSSKFSISGSSATWHSELHWRDSWSASKIPVYFILVILDHDDRPDWISHDTSGTHQRAAAFWVRVNELGDDEKVRIPKTQRLTIDSLQIWAREVDECFSPEAA